MADTEIKKTDIADENLYANLDPKEITAKVAELDKSIQGLFVSLKTLKKDLNDVGLNKASDIAKLNQLLQDQEVSIKKVNAATKERVSLAKAAAIATEAQAKAAVNVAKAEKINLDAQLKKEAAQKRSFIQSAKNTIQAAKESNEYEKQNKRLRELFSSIADLQAKQQSGHALNVQQINDLKNQTAEYGILYTRLSNIEQGLGRSQRQVGNYALSTNRLGFSFAQIARELPAMTLGFQTFALAISNNIPIAQDELGKLRKEMELLRKTGAVVPSMFSQIVKSLFTFQVASAVVIALFTVFAGAIADWTESLFNNNAELERQNKLLEREQQLIKNQIELSEERNKAIRETIKTQQELRDTRKEDIENITLEGVKEQIRIAIASAEVNKFSEEIIKSLKTELSLLENVANIKETDQEKESRRIRAITQLKDIELKGLRERLDREKELESIIGGKQVRAEKALKKAQEERIGGLAKQQALKSGGVGGVVVSPVLSLFFPSQKEVDKLSETRDKFNKELDQAIIDREDTQNKISKLNRDLIKEIEKSEKPKDGKKEKAEDIIIGRDYTRYIKDLDNRKEENAKFFKLQKQLIEQDFLNENDNIAETAKNQVDLQIRGGETQKELDEINKQLDSAKTNSEKKRLSERKTKLEETISQKRIQLEDELTQTLFAQNIEKRNNLIIIQTQKEIAEDFNLQQEKNQKEFETKQRIREVSATQNKTGTTGAYLERLRQIQSNAEFEANRKVSKIATDEDVRNGVKDIEGNLVKLGYAYESFANNVDERAKIILNANDQIVQEQNAFFNKQIDRIDNFGNIVLDQEQKVLDRRFKQEQDYYQRSINAQQSNISTQAQLASRGRANTLAESEADAQQSELKLRQSKERQAKIERVNEMVKAFWNSFTTLLKKDNYTAARAAAEATAGVGLGTLAEKGLTALFGGSYFEGTEDTGGRGTADGRGGKWSILHPHEGVVTEKGNQETKGLVGAVNKFGFEGAKDWAMENINFQNSALNKPVLVDKPMKQQVDNALLSIVSNKLDTMNKSLKVIEQKPSYDGMTFEETGEFVRRYTTNFGKELRRDFNKYLKG